ncbi:hypothetical protein [Parapedobacter koreensis]|uniref:Uncharacterized protein n=1 Tax=Parapedobacter koreensis TaxID=332977 RepID=A0A1H7NLJ7_9SPHI|nr:hypothetical protein [Parapedobacter koreensis]SEL24209.1 hypothetical protein SAMN05421740_10427 [Parapedobacter koreensis]
MFKFTKAFALILIVVFAPAACKDDITKPPLVFSVYQHVVTPGEIVFVSVSGEAKHDAIQTNINGTAVQLINVDTSLYAFLMPIMEPGSYRLSLREWGAETSPELTVGDYQPIQNPAMVVDEYLTNCTRALAEVEAEDFEQIIPESRYANDLALINSLSLLVDRLADEELQLVAYHFRFLQRQTDRYASMASVHPLVDYKQAVPLSMQVRSAANHVSPDRSAIPFAANVTGTDGLPNDLVEYIWKATTYNEAAATAKFAAIVAASTGWVALGMTGGTAAAIIVGGLVIEKECERKAAIYNHYIAEYPLRAKEIEQYGDDPFYVYENKPSIRQFIRNQVTVARENVSEFPVAIRNVVAGDGTLERLSLKLKGSLDKLVSVFDGIFDLKGIYTPYVSTYNKAPSVKETVFEGTETLKITNVDNPNIQIKLENTAAGLVFSASNPSGNIDQVTTLNVTIEYDQEALDNTISTDIRLTYVPEEKEDEVEEGMTNDPITIENIYGSWRITSTTFQMRSGQYIQQSLPGEFFSVTSDSRFVGNWALLETSGLWMLTDPSTITLYGFSNPEITVSSVPLYVFTALPTSLVVGIPGTSEDEYVLAYVFMIR